MADIADVENALREAVQAVRDATFPGTPVYRGWPADKVLDDATKSGQTIVTISQRPGFARDDTRYPNEESELPRLAPTLTVSVVGNVVTFAGACSPDHLAGVKLQNGVTVVHRCLPGDTPAIVAADLAIPSGGVASGAVLTVPNLAAAATGRDGGTIRPTRQQEVGFSVIVWAPDPVKRDAISGEIDAGLSDIEFLTLPDGSFGRLKWAGSTSTDRTQVDDFYRRDLNYSVNFSTTISGSRPSVLFPSTTINQGGPYAPQGATL